MSRWANSGPVVEALEGSACRNFQMAQRLSRRDALRVGGLAGFGLSLPGVLRAQDLVSVSSAPKPLAATLPVALVVTASLAPQAVRLLLPPTMQ